MRKRTQLALLLVAEAHHQGERGGLEPIDIDRAHIDDLGLALLVDFFHAIWRSAASTAGQYRSCSRVRPSRFLMLAICALLSTWRDSRVLAAAAGLAGVAAFASGAALVGRRVSCRRAIHPGHHGRGLRGVGHGGQVIGCRGRQLVGGTRAQQRLLPGHARVGCFHHRGWSRRGGRFIPVKWEPGSDDVGGRKRRLGWRFTTAPICRQNERAGAQKCAKTRESKRARCLEKPPHVPPRPLNPRRRPILLRNRA